MSIRIYSLVAIAVAGVGVGLTLAADLSTGTRRESAARGEPTAIREVYVDVSQLTKLHPRWETLVAMRSTAASAAGSENAIAADGSPMRPRQSNGTDGSLVSASRNKLSAEAAKAAEDALVRLEAEQREALSQRLGASRKTMEESAEADLKVRAQEIEAARDEKLRAAMHGYCPDRLNAKLKESALKVAANSPGIDKKLVEAKLVAIRSELDRIAGVCAVETNEIEAEAHNTIKEIVTSAAARIEAALSIRESGEIRRIESRANSARSDLLSELYAFDFSPRSAKTISADGAWTLRQTTDARRFVNRTTPEANNSRQMWNRKTADLEVRIRADIDRAVRQIASEKGVRVTLSRGGSDVPNETQAFADALRKHALALCGPVLCEMRG